MEWNGRHTPQITSNVRKELDSRHTTDASKPLLAELGTCRQIVGHDGLHKVASGYKDGDPNPPGGPVLYSFSERSPTGLAPYPKVEDRASEGHPEGVILVERQSPCGA